MLIIYNATGSQRKSLVHAIRRILEVPATYKGAPSFEYDIDGYTVTRDGNLKFSDRKNSEEVETLIEQLGKKGFHTELATEPEPAGLTISMPADFFDEETLQNLKNLLTAKGALIRRALGVTELPIEVGDEEVSFPWFTYTPEDADTVKAYTHFITSLCEMAKTQIRISPKEKEVENPKYAFRCFLLRLGFIGEAYKAERKILLKNLPGSASYKGGASHALSK